MSLSVLSCSTFPPMQLTVGSVAEERETASGGPEHRVNHAYRCIRSVQPKNAMTLALTLIPGGGERSSPLV